MLVAKLDREYFGDEHELIGKEWYGSNKTFEDASRKRWKLVDDDGIVYYGGWLLDDAGCIAQSEILAWGMNHAGATTIYIRAKPTDAWEQVIG